MLSKRIFPCRVINRRFGVVRGFEGVSGWGCQMGLFSIKCVCVCVCAPQALLRWFVGFCLLAGSSWLVQRTPICGVLFSPDASRPSYFMLEGVLVWSRANVYSRCPTLTSSNRWLIWWRLESSVPYFDTVCFCGRPFEC